MIADEKIIARAGFHGTRSVMAARFPGNLRDLPRTRFPPSEITISSPFFHLDSDISISGGGSLEITVVSRNSFVSFRCYSVLLVFRLTIFAEYLRFSDLLANELIFVLGD